MKTNVSLEVHVQDFRSPQQRVIIMNDILLIYHKIVYWDSIRYLLGTEGRDVHYAVI